MLQPAQLYKEEIRDKMIRTWYETEYQYYYSGYYRSIPEISDEVMSAHHFVSLDKDGNIIGYISYQYNDVNKSCYNFGAISFDKGNYQFGQDLIEVIYNIFFKFNFRRLEFFCYLDNPSFKGYQKMIKRYGGRQVGILKQAQYLNGKHVDAAIFEVLKSNLTNVIDTKSKFKESETDTRPIITKLEYDIKRRNKV